MSEYECNNDSCGNMVTKKGNHCGYECKIEVLERQLEEARGELGVMDKANYKCSQRCLVYIEEFEAMRTLAKCAIETAEGMGANVEWLEEQLREKGDE